MYLANVNNKMKSRWLWPFPITQVNYYRNNYTVDVNSSYQLRHIHNTGPIVLFEPYHKNDHQGFPQCHYAETGPVKDDMYEVEKAIKFRFSHLLTDLLNQIIWKTYLPSDN